VLDDARTIAAEVPRASSGVGPHAVTGPVAILGACRGDLFRVETLRLERRARYGVVSNRHLRGVLAGSFPDGDRPSGPPSVVSHLARVAEDVRSGTLTDAPGRTIRFPLREFLDLVGVAPDADHDVDSTPPGPHGGDLDVRHLGAGTWLLLPVNADGAPVYAGDPHYAQRHGEVALTAFEAPLRATLRVSVERGAAARRVAALVAHPVRETEHSLVAVGTGTTLDVAMRAATAHTVVVVREHTGLDAPTALEYHSVAGDFEISQAVNAVRGVHCVIDKRQLASVSERAATCSPEQSRYVGAPAVELPR
jgi:acetamidase/formamidase